MSETGAAADSQALGALEQRCGGSPFDSVQKLNAVVRHCRDPKNIEWCFCAIADKVICGGSAGADFTFRAVKGTMAMHGATVLTHMLDIFMSRRAFLRHCGLTLLEQLDPATCVRHTFWAAFETHAKYRDNLVPASDAPHSDLSWRAVGANWPGYIRAFFTWVENVVFKDDYYQLLAIANKNCAGPSFIIDLEPHTWGGIKEAHKLHALAHAKAFPPRPQSAQGADGTNGAAALARQGADGTNASGAAALARQGGSPVIPHTVEDQAAATLAQEDTDQMMAVWVSVVVEPDTQEELTNHIVNSAAGKYTGSDCAGQRLHL